MPGLERAVSRGLPWLVCAAMVLLGSAGAAEAQVCEAGPRHTLRNAVNCHDTVFAVRITVAGAPAVFDHAPELGNSGPLSLERAVFTRYPAVITAVLKAHPTLGDVGTAVVVAHRGGEAMSGEKRLTTPTAFRGLVPGREYLVFGDLWQELGAFVVDDLDVFEFTPSGLTASPARMADAEVASSMEGRTLAEATGLVHGLMAELLVRMASASARTRALPVVSPETDASLGVYAALVAARCGLSHLRPGAPLVRRELRAPGETMRGSDVVALGEAIGAARTHIDRFTQQPGADAALPEDAGLDWGITLIDAAEVERLRDGDVFRGLTVRYPLAPALLTFSRVVFNAEATEALVACRITDGTDEPETDLVRLTRETSRWTVAGSRAVEQP